MKSLSKLSEKTLLELVAPLLTFIVTLPTTGVSGRTLLTVSGAASAAERTWGLLQGPARASLCSSITLNWGGRLCCLTSAALCHSCRCWKVSQLNSSKLSASEKASKNGEFPLAASVTDEESGEGTGGGTVVGTGGGTEGGTWGETGGRSGVEIGMVTNALTGEGTLRSVDTKHFFGSCSLELLQGREEVCAT